MLQVLSWNMQHTCRTLYAVRTRPSGHYNPVFFNTTRHRVLYVLLNDLYRIGPLRDDVGLTSGPRWGRDASRRRLQTLVATSCTKVRPGSEAGFFLYSFFFLSTNQGEKIRQVVLSGAECDKVDLCKLVELGKSN